MVDLEILQPAVLEAKDPAVHNGEAVGLVRLLDRRRLDDVAALLNDVELHQPVVARLLFRDGVELGLVQPVDVADVAQPGVQDAQVARGHGSLDTAAAVVTTDDDVLDLQVLHGVVDNAHDVEVDAADEVGDVAVDEGLAGPQSRDLLGRDARVRTPNPEVFRLLASRQF